MTAPLLSQLSRRIRQLERQSYLILGVIFAIIVYGFYISSRSSETTAGDLNRIRASAQRADLTSEMLESRARMTQLIFTMTEQFDNIGDNLDDLIRGLPGLSEKILSVNTYAFNADFPYAAAYRRGQNLARTSCY